MHHLGILAVILVFGLLIVLLAGIFFIWALIRMKGGKGMKREEDLTEEARLIQEIHQGLARMEERIEALETIILYSTRKDQEK